MISFRRTAARDTVLAGQPIATGDDVLTVYTSVNRDGRPFENAKCYDISRRPNPHVTFGPGRPHFSLGANLARLVSKGYFRELFRQIPDIALSGDLIYVADPLLDDPESLPCSFTPRPRAASPKGSSLPARPKGSTR